MAASPTRINAMDHVVVVLFENRSLDNLLGRLYGPGDGKTFEGVLGKDLSNPIPEWAEHGADRKVVPYGLATDMDSPNPDSGEEYFHTNTQLFNTLDEHNRFKIGGGVTAPWNAPPAGRRRRWTGSSPTTGTLRKIWDLGEPLTARDAAARTFEQVFTRDEPTDPKTWTTIQAQPVPEWTLDPEVLGRTLSALGKAAIPGLIAHAKQRGVQLPAGVDDPGADPALLVQALRDISLHYFPALSDGALAHDEQH